MSFDSRKLPYYKDEIEETYSSILAPYAVKKPKPNSRLIPEPVRDKENRSDFQRDRDRIIHSQAFRRLMYKTQVFVNHEGDHFRTRLTHTLEVSQFARGICKSLALNEDLAEAIALGHDLGHTPFGHAVERYFSEELLKRDMGNFYHNEQSLRVVDYLEKRTDEYVGLNLTAEVREGILKHNSDSSGIYASLNPQEPCHSLEGQVVNLVDTIAYICHDLQDGITSGLVEQALKTNDDFKSYFKEISNIIEAIIHKTPDFSRYSNTYFIDKLIHAFIMSITEQSANNIKKYQINSIDDIIEHANKGITIIALDKENEKHFKELKKLIYKSIYKSYTISTMDSKAENVVRDLFESFNANPNLLPPKEFYKYNHIANDSPYDGAENSQVRVICDYISCMTDRFALEEHERIKNPRIKI